MAKTISTRVERGGSFGCGIFPGLVITCEHGGNRIPAVYRDYFRAYGSLPDTHRGYDPGALEMARALARAFRAPLVSATVSRLLVDLNRSIGHPQLHFETIHRAPAPVRRNILAQYYTPFRSEAERLIRQAIAERGQVIHLSSHSFAPEFHGRVRNADVGLLYDPARPGEAALCERWKAALKVCAPTLTVRRNYPYEGRNDGFTTWLRKRLAPNAYIGIELELNQGLVVAPDRSWAPLRRTIIKSLRTALAVCGADTAAYGQ
jgi:predicted N-formylglutamate amidohydrolase